ncbi:DUF4974 domain-containing protein [Sphingobacterium shayense]|uniref:FecR family protein n=1 Tax=Sphingobacterium shayense TaxID=626343 RepID=UPI00155584D1|nr:FecR domain-containing protein [Sphingobacterium shayense]NQD69521.1 DUF4974 domain-containing protein [Sphingobacterium shayense]
MTKLNHYKARSLLQKYIDGKCSEQEIALIEEWYLSLNKGVSDFPDKETIADFVELQKKLEKIPAQKARFKGYIPAAAAAVLTVVTLAVLWTVNTKEENEIVQNPVITTDILPGTDRALLSIDGQPTIELNNQREGLISKGTVLRYADGTTVAEVEKEKTVTLSTPIAGQFKVTLPDGTKAWLNAVSSISYPTVFHGAKRIIRVTGEVYLEVAEDAQKPFVVESDNQQIEVLGTSFNIDAYRDNGETFITLASGSLRVKNTISANEAILRPGQQAIIGDSEFIQVRKASVEDISSWKDGLYILNEERLSQYARKIERWYDVQMDMGTHGERRLSAIVPRDAKLSEVLQAIELKTEIKFIRKGRRIVAMN